MNPIANWLFANALLLAPAGLAAQSDTAAAKIEVVAVPAEQAPAPPPISTTPSGWHSYYRCPDAASARRVLAALKAARPRFVEEAGPIFARSVAAERCQAAGDSGAAYDWPDSEMAFEGVEFEGDGYGVDFHDVRDLQGRPAPLIYTRGAC